MDLFTKEIHDQLLKNGLIRKNLKDRGRPEPDFYPVAEVCPETCYGTWLLSDINPVNPNMIYGLHDFGTIKPFKGYVDFTELVSLLEKSNHVLKCVPCVPIKKTLKEHEEIAQLNGYIVTDY